jgi:ferric-chelate reductase
MSRFCLWSEPLNSVASITPLYSQLASIVQCSRSPLHVSIHYTRASKNPVPFQEEKLVPGISLSPGRPRISKVLEGVMARAVSLGYGAKDNEAITGVLVGLCGPVGLRDEVVQIVGRVDSGKRNAVGGVEIYEE